MHFSIAVLSVHILVFSTVFFIQICISIMTKLRLIPSTRFLPETPFIYEEPINGTTSQQQNSLNRWQLRRLEYKLNKMNSFKKNGQQIRVVKYGDPSPDLSDQPMNLKKSSSLFNKYRRFNNVRSRQFNGYRRYQPRNSLRAQSEVYSAAQVQRVFFVPTLHNGKTFYTLGTEWLNLMMNKSDVSASIVATKEPWLF